MNTLFSYTLNVKGAELTGESEGQPLIALNPSLLATLDYIVVSGVTVTHASSFSWSTGRKEMPFFVGTRNELTGNVIDHNRVVYLRPEHVSRRTSASTLVINIDTTTASIVTPMGWVNTLASRILVPEDMSECEFNEWLNTQLDNISFAPYYNTAGLEAAAELAGTAWKRFKGTINNSLMGSFYRSQCATDTVFMSAMVRLTHGYMNEVTFMEPSAITSDTPPAMLTLKTCGANIDNTRSYLVIKGSPIKESLF